MTERSNALRDSQKDFLAYYGKKPTRAELAVEREVFGINAGIVSYTTPEQANELAGALELKPGVRLLEIGAGTGWPGVYLTKETNCEAVLTDVPAVGIRLAAKRAAQQGLQLNVAGVVAAGSRLPFRARSFDAVVHCDVLC